MLQHFPLISLILTTSLIAFLLFITGFGGYTCCSHNPRYSQGLWAGKVLPVKSVRNERGCLKGCLVCFLQCHVPVPEKAINEILGYSGQPVCGRVEL